MHSREAWPSRCAARRPLVQQEASEHAVQREHVDGRVEDQHVQPPEKKRMVQTWGRNRGPPSSIPPKLLKSL